MTTLQFADTYNLVMFLSKPAESEGFEQIVDFLNANPIKYALTINPTIYTSCIEQFWATVKVKTVNGEIQLQALVDGKKIIVSEASVRRDLQLNDEEGTDCLPNATSFEELTRMGAKTTAWNEFSSIVASVIICLVINQKFNFSNYIFESMVKNLENVSGFLFRLMIIGAILIRDSNLDPLPESQRSNEIWKSSMLDDMLKGVLKKLCCTASRAGAAYRNTVIFTPVDRAFLGHPVTLGLAVSSDSLSVTQGNLRQTLNCPKTTLCLHCYFEAGKVPEARFCRPKPKIPPGHQEEDPARTLNLSMSVVRPGHWMRKLVLEYLAELKEEKNKPRSYPTRYGFDSMMSKPTLPKSFFWDYALETAASILNMVPTKKVEKTPCEVWHGQAPKLSYLKIWGCEALVKRDTLTKPDKLEPRSIKCIFIGYPKETMGYSFYYPLENKVYVAWNAEFLENGLIDQEASGSLDDLEIIQEEDTHPSIDTSLNHEEDDLKINEPQSDIIPIRRSTRTRHPTDSMCLYIDAEEHELGDLGEPANYKAALLDPESDKWLNAMNVDMQSMKDNEVWELVNLPPDGKTFGHKWLFKKKTDMDGAVQTYKARLVAKGFTQTPGIDYEETFSHVADIRAIMILIAIVAFYDYEIWQIDVKTAPSSMDISMKRVSCYTDAGYLKDADDMKSQTGYVFILNGGVVDWKSTKQSIFVTSSTDAEYIAAFDASTEAVWICKFISGLGVVLTIEEPINMYYDNTGAISIAKDHGVTKGARYFRVKVHYLRETIIMGDVKTENVDTNDNLVGPFTKALSYPKHSKLTKDIGLIPPCSLM
ncbi:retrotransposon protein, putative, ty1-copia subclass [Tanacetum coccineum]